MAEAMTDHYGTLGVERTASDDEIKKAWRRVARETHPDIHGDDEEKTARFKLAKSAYAMLGDPVKRKRYDLMIQIEDSKRPCSTCGRPVYDRHTLCRFCRVAAEQERRRYKHQQRHQRHRADLRAKAARLRAELEAEQAREYRRARDTAMNDQAAIEDEFGVFGNDSGMGLPSSDDLLQSLLAEAAIEGANRKHKPKVAFGRNGVTLELRPGMRVTVDKDTIEVMRQVHRNLTTADRLIRQVKRWF